MIRECLKCGGNLRVSAQKVFRVKSIGIDGVDVLDAVEQAICTVCHEVAYTTIPDLPELIAAVALWRCMIPIKLNAEEIGFLRDALGLKQKELAEKLGIQPESVSRWLSGQTPISDGNEKDLRQCVGAQLREKAPAIRFDAAAVGNMKIQGPRPQRVIPMSFCRVLVAPEQESWNPRKIAANQ